VTEQEWESCTDPERMLEFLRGKASDRKRRLFAVACARRIWPSLTDERSRRAVEAAECYADGLVAGAALEAACAAAQEAQRAAQETFTPEDPRAAVLEGAERSPWEAAAAAPLVSVQCAQPTHRTYSLVDVSGSCAEAAAWAALATDVSAWDSTVRAEYAAQATVLRDIFPYSLRAPSLDPAWLAWHGGAAVKLAQTVYEERELPSGHLDAARLAILADMLEEAGCSDPQLRGHLRLPGPHVRGCWALDVLLNKS
jgi:hypothetical protein